MTTYTFDQLDERGQANAINLYYADPDYTRFCDKMKEELPEEVMLEQDFFRAAGWRFTEHGERIA